MIDVAPPPTSGPRMQELGDRLIVYFRPRRSWGTLVFLAVWLLGWTAGGLFVVSQLPRASPGEAAFLLLWLCGWVFGECGAVFVVGWQLFGRELLAVTPDYLEVRKEIGPFARTKMYDAALVQDVAAARVPHDEDEGPRPDFCLRISYGDETLRIGEGMGEREADYIASAVLSRIRGRSWWSDEVDVRRSSAHERSRAGTATLAAGHFRVTETDRKSTTLLVGTLIAGLTIGGTLLAALLGSDESAHRTTPPRTAPSIQRPPAQRDFPNARAYAATMTSYLLTSARTSVLGRPECGKRVTWTQWACRVRAKATVGPFAGRPLPFRCSSVSTGGFICGPDIRGQMTAPLPHPNG